ncbi:sulfotransferase [Paraglaciecola aestuariivivens]
MLSHPSITNNDVLLMTDQGQAAAQQLIEEVWRLVRLKSLDQASLLSQKLTQDYPQYAAGWQVASVIAMQLGQSTSALNYIQNALNIQPDNRHWLLDKARLLFICQQRSAARQLAIELSQTPIDSVAYCAELALLLNKLGLHQESLDWYQQALSIQPNNAQLLFNLASLQRFMGLLVEAQQSLDKLIQLNPQDSEAWLLRSSLLKQTPNANHIAELQKALTLTTSPLPKAQLYYALGKELEDLKQYPQCFDAWQNGASVRRRHMQYSVENDLATLEKIAQVFDAQTFQQNLAGYNDSQPIFIVGLPRTGSTLVERIISSHSDVFSAGELNNFALEMMQLVRKQFNQPPANKLELISATKNLDFATLGKNYINSTRPDTTGYKRFIDKLPLNSLYIGLIHLALPKAKIIYVQRHPMDSCLAMFKQIFTQGYPFSYDLEELARYQIAHYKLMAHWQQVLPGVIHNISYENLVADLSKQTQALLNYCELPWQDQCCEFEQNSSAATTASASQVRQPVYSSSVGKWKHFSQALAPVKSLFEQAGIPCE